MILRSDQGKEEFNELAFEVEEMIVDEILGDVGEALAETLEHIQEKEKLIQAKFIYTQQLLMAMFTCLLLTDVCRV